MTKDEILRYIFLCVKYKHDNDISPCITKSACEKENLLFEAVIELLDKWDKENTELKEKLEHRNCVDCSNHGSNIKLFKAKEIIKKIEKVFYSGENSLKRLSEISDILKEAENFIKEE